MSQSVSRSLKSHQNVTLTSLSLNNVLQPVVQLGDNRPVPLSNGQPTRLIKKIPTSPVHSDRQTVHVTGGWMDIRSLLVSGYIHLTTIQVDLRLVVVVSFG